MKKQPLLIVGTLLLIVGVVVLIGVFAMRGGEGDEGREIDSVTAQKDGNTLTVSRDGHVVYSTSGGVFEDFWDKEKTDTFFGYINSKYSGEGDLISGGENYILINGQTSYAFSDDELINQIGNETGGGGGPTPTSSSQGQGQGGGGSGSGPTPTPPGGGGGSGGSSGGGPDPECLYWRLSYCVRPRTPRPSPTATPVTVEIREPDCGVNTQTGKTVIGNDLCISTPSPTP